MRRSRAALLFLVCLLFGSQWLLRANGEAPSSELASLVLGAILSSVMTGVWLWTRRQVPRAVDLRSWTLVFSGVGAVGAPALMLLMGQQQFSSVMAVATQASLPVIVAISLGWVEPESELQKRLVPALIALAGGLLVLPVALPRSSQGWHGFLLYLAAVCSSGVSSVFCHREMVRMSPGAGLFFVSAGNAMILGSGAAIWLTISGRWQSASTMATLQNLAFIVITAVSILLTGMLLQLLPPMAAASRVVFSPLIAAVEAYVLLRPTLSLRLELGAVLMLLGGLMCVSTDQEPSDSGHMSLH